jgi:CBS domain-containing protein
MAMLAGTVRFILESKNSGTDAVAPDDTVLRALELMVERNVRALVVIEGDGLAGILTEHDYARGVELQGRTARETRVREIMTANVVTVGPDDSVEKCNLLMHRHRIHHLPVVGEGRVLGMVSAHDVLEEMVAEEEEQIQGLETERLMIRTGNY